MLFATSFPMCPDAGTFHFETLAAAVRKGEKSGWSWRVDAGGACQASGNGQGGTTYRKCNFSAGHAGECVFSASRVEPMRGSCEKLYGVDALEIPSAYDESSSAAVPAHNLPAECPCAPCRASEGR